MKKYIGLLLAVLLLLSLFTACSKNDDYVAADGLLCYGDTESKKPLRIFMDIQTTGFGDVFDYKYNEKIMHEFLAAVRTNIGEQEVVIEFLLNDSNADATAELTATRATTVSRMRVELLSGGGPDVLIMQYNKRLTDYGYDLDSDDILIKSPQKVMESGLFLTLDEYIENHSQYVEWEKFPKAIMDAGRNDEGQQIIPLTYTLPVLICPKEVFDHTPTRQLTWDDMFADPELAPFSADLINSHDYNIYSDPTIPRWMDYLEFSLGAIADYKTGELLFTEEELLQRLRDVDTLPKEDIFPESEEEYLSVDVRSHLQPVTLLPVYSDDGGISARIESYVAINRNTAYPEASFAVIDTLLSSEAQQNFKIYAEYLFESGATFGGVPLNDDIGLYQNKENFEEMCELREQISSAYFDGEPSVLLEGMTAYYFQFSKEETEEYIHNRYTDLQRRVRE